jgi:hypothetical protein
VFAVFLFSNCDNSITDDDKENNYGYGIGDYTPWVDPYVPKTEYGARFQNILEKQYHALDKMLDTISLYYDEAYIKSLHKNGESLRLEDFSTYFDANKTRTITDEYGNEYTTTLGIELAEIAQVFMGELSLLKPDLSVFKQMNGVVYRNGSLMVPEMDMIIDTDTLYGILTLDMKIAEMAGDDMKAFSDDMNAVNENYLAQLGINGDYTADAGGLEPDKAVYQTSTPIHAGGKIYYSWGGLILDIEEDHKTALKEAMKDWEDAVNGVGGDIEFIDKTNDAFHQVFASILLVKLRAMISGELGGDIRGMAIWGGMPGRTHLTIDSGLENKTGKTSVQFALYRTARHELGHVLGLHHEHQRWDRDDYVTVPNEGGTIWDLLNPFKWPQFVDRFEGMLNSERLKEFPSISLPVIRFKWETIGSGWFKIDIPIPYFEWVDIEVRWEIFRLADSYGGFDYNSIMLYGGKFYYFKKDFAGVVYEWKDKIGSSVKDVPREFRVGDEIPFNVKITENDARTVKQLYESKWWQFW